MDTLEEPLAPEVEPGEINARYDMGPEEAKELCREFLAQPDLNLPNSKYGGYIIDATSPFSNLGRFVESSVFEDEFGNGSEVMREEYTPYDAASEFYIAIDHEAELPIGVMRVIKPSEAGLKSLNDLEKIDVGCTGEEVCESYGVDPSRTADIATLAVLPDYRGSETGYLPSLIVYRMLWPQVIANPDYDNIVTIIDKKAEKNLQTLRFPFEPVFDGKYFSYLDSPESRFLLAKNAAFYPQLTDTIRQMREEIGDKEGTTEELIANTIDALVNPGFIDGMLSEPIAANDEN
jgi:hypothetical protein